MYLSPNFYTNQHSIALFVDLSFIEMFKKGDSRHQIVARLPPGFWHLLFKQGFLRNRLILTFKTFFERNQRLVEKYSVSCAHMTKDSIGIG
jgi:hypothetical protein